MKSKATQGKWTASNYSGQGRIYREWGIFANGKRIATVKDAPTAEETYANALLMANAKELLEALEDAVFALNVLKVHGYHGTKAKLQKALIVIQKAKGE